MQDLLLWCTSEFGYVRFGDGFVQSSSIMPQKRNPVAIEHARAIGSKALGQAQAILTTVHNTPFGDIVDTEDDLQPLVFSMFRDATRAVKLTAAAMRTAEFNVEYSRQPAQDGWTTLTELADTLTRDHGLPFRVSHAICSRVVRADAASRDRSLSSLVAEISQDLCGTPLAYTDEALATILSPRHFVNVRRTLGGPAPEETARASHAARQQLDDDGAWWSSATASLRSAERRLEERAEPVTRLYVRVLVLEAAILVALWLFGRAFS